MTLPPNPQDPLAELLTQLGSEIGGPLNQALERLQAQLADRRGDADALLALREPLRRARDATLLAAQIGRLAGGRVQPKSQICALHLVLHQVVEGRRREAQVRGLQLRMEADETEVLSDPNLLPSLLHALLDWALWHTRSSIELRVGLQPWPARVLLSCRFATRDLDQTPAPPPPDLNGLRWMLLAQTARALGLELRREDETGVCVAQLGFPLPGGELVGSLQLESSTDPAYDTQPFAGWSALIVGADASFHQEVSQLMEPQGWALDLVQGIDEAFAHVLTALPQAIVVDGRLAGADLQQWRSHVLTEAPGLCFIEVGERPALAGDGRFCPRAELPTLLPSLLRTALAAGGGQDAQALTFRL